MAKVHGERGLRTKEYTAWAHMVQRCRNPKHHAYKNYGGRGISVCERWLKFETFLEDVGRAPSKEHSLDRFPNNNGNYEPGNIRWATTFEQARNKRTRIYEGVPDGKSLIQLAEDYGVKYKVLLGRLDLGWDLRIALTSPVRRGIKYRTLIPKSDQGTEAG